MTEKVKHATSHLIATLEAALAAARDLHSELSVVPPPAPPAVKRPPPSIGKPKLMAAPTTEVPLELMNRAQLRELCLKAGHTQEAVNGKTIAELRALIA